MDKIGKEVKAYYDAKITIFGTTPQGVDWNSIESQELRFEMLSKIITSGEHFSILDYGCGFGSMFGYFEEKFKNFDYLGYDLSDKMIAAANEKFSNEKAIFTNQTPNQKVDYVIASGIFNIKLDNTSENWLLYIQNTLTEINNLAKKGFAFNILTSYSDFEFMKEYLYYANPSYIFDFCKKHFSRNVALLHDYDLYEFTILVRK
ncbi:class I SAM-dependent methyltransferase [Flavobacterium antarcticum]|uniref:class I SAM-dependent methyltransferase n=1 Tax=Flavobacterium antarcticum TaxID=271155 RepID=UPI0003B4DE05|nr:class I SAM-dependent methyltransferase [Flavobacterium antarcticum]